MLYPNCSHTAQDSESRPSINFKVLLKYLMQLAPSCTAAIYCAMRKTVPYIDLLSTAIAGERSKMLTSFIRYVQTWRQYGTTVRELSNLNDRELADLGITRSDIPHVAWDHVRR